MHAPIGPEACCDVKMFCFWRTNRASTNLKKFLHWNSTSLIYLSIPSSAETWKILKYFNIDLSP